MPLHKDLTGTDLHEPKGIASATSGTVYLADGAGSGAWTPLDTRVPAGAIQDFATPIAPSGWLECDGTDVSSTTYADLYSATTIQQNGTRTSASAIVTSLGSTTNIKAGYFVVGTGIASGTTVVSVDSSTQITLSATASSSGTSNVIVSPWFVTLTTIRLPDVKTSGRYRRSRTTSTQMGVSQADQNKAHAHSGSSVTAAVLNLTTGGTGAHTHTGTTDEETVNHTHVYHTASNKDGIAGVSGGETPIIKMWYGDDANAVTSGENTAHTHAFSITSSGGHTHTVDAGHTHDLTIASDGGSEVRPLTIVLMTCIRT